MPPSTTSTHSPSLSHRKRKGIPCRAPPSRTNKHSSSPSTDHLKASLLLLALLRDGRNNSHNLNNTRYTSPTKALPIAGGAGLKRKKERDLLPEADLVAYGRGKRSASAGGVGGERAASPILPVGASGKRGKISPEIGVNSSGLGSGSRKLKRSLSIDITSTTSTSPSSNNNLLSPLSARAGGAGGLNMTRAASAGPSAHHQFIGAGHDDHVPSPLARSFSFAGSGNGGEEVTPHKRSVSNGREARKLDVPHHLQGYDMGGSYVR